MADWQPFYPPGKATKGRHSRWSSCSTLGLVTRSRKLCGGEAVSFTAILYLFETVTMDCPKGLQIGGGGLSLERSEKNGGPGACPRKFLEIHHIECRKTPHYATFSRPLSDRPVLESSSKRLVSKQAVSLINSEFEEKRSVILIVIWSITCLKTSHKTSEQPGVSSRLTSQGL